MRYVDAGYVIALTVLALYACSLLARRRRLERVAARGATTKASARAAARGATAETSERTATRAAARARAATPGVTGGQDAVRAGDAPVRDPRR